MKVIIEFDTENAAFEDNPCSELRHVLRQAERKFYRQLARQTRGVVCTAPEDADKLLDTNGNTVGTVKIIKNLDEVYEEVGPVDLRETDQYNPEGLPLDEEDQACGLCGGPLVPLGGLGTRTHFRCRDCGADSSSMSEEGQ